MFDSLKKIASFAVALPAAVTWDAATLCTFGEESLTLKLLTGDSEGGDNNHDDRKDDELD